MRWRDQNQPHEDLVRQFGALPPEEILGVSPGAGRSELRSAWLKRLKVYHPDRSDPFLRAHNEEMVKIINQAYQALLDRLTDAQS